MVQAIDFEFQGKLHQFSQLACWKPSVYEPQKIFLWNLHEMSPGVSSEGHGLVTESNQILFLEHRFKYFSNLCSVLYKSTIPAF